MKEINFNFTIELGAQTRALLISIFKLDQKAIDDLRVLLRESKEKLRRLKFDLAAGKVKNVREIRSIKKEIARILTIINVKTRNE